MWLEVGQELRLTASMLADRSVTSRTGPLPWLVVGGTDRPPAESFRLLGLFLSNNSSSSSQLLKRILLCQLNDKKIACIAFFSAIIKYQITEENNDLIKFLSVSFTVQFCLPAFLILFRLLLSVLLNVSLSNMIVSSHSAYRSFHKAPL